MTPSLGVCMVVGMSKSTTPQISKGFRKSTQTPASRVAEKKMINFLVPTSIHHYLLDVAVAMGDAHGTGKWSLSSLTREALDYYLRSEEVAKVLSDAGVEVAEVRQRETMGLAR